MSNVDLSWMNEVGPDGLTWVQRNSPTQGVDLSWINNLSEFERQTMLQNLQRAQQAPVAAPATPQPTQQQNDAMSQMRAYLKNFNLETLAEPLWDYIVKNGIDNQDQLWLWIQDREEFNKRFPAFKLLQEQNRAISPAQYVELERNYAQVMRASNVPVQFFDNPDDFTDLIKNNVSPAEFQSRIEKGYQKVAQADPMVRETFKQYFGIDSDNALAAFFIDPDRSAPALERAAQTAVIGAALNKNGLDVDLNYATKLTNLGISEQQALEGVSRLNSMRSLFEQNVGESNIIPDSNNVSSLPSELVRRHNTEYHTVATNSTETNPSVTSNTSTDNMTDSSRLGLDYVFGTNAQTQRELQLRLAQRKAESSGTSQQIVTNRRGESSLGKAK